jgi:outer membrane protein assembly factor BamB
MRDGSMKAVLLGVLSVAVFSADPKAVRADWTEFRGPEQNGHSAAKKLPLVWSETNNVVWKTAIHNLGWSSPVIWGDQIWITTATENGRQLFAVCVNSRTGKIVHDVKVFDNPAPQHVASVNSYASPTPAIEAGRVYAHYGTYGTACLDTRDGKILWSRRDLTCDHQEGPGSSLMLYKNLLCFNVDGRDVQYVIALDKGTGKTVWKTKRSVDYTSVPTHMRKAFSTPIILEAGGRAQLFSPGAKAMMAYDPQSGKEIWRIRYNGYSMVARPLFGHGLLYVVTDYDPPELWAVRLDGQGEVAETYVAWKAARDIPRVASLLLVDDLLYMANEEGYASCLEAKTGNPIWRQRLKGKYWASPICGAGRIYFFSDKNLTTVIQPGREFKMLAENQLEGCAMATPAVTGDAIILRSKTHLYRLEDRAGRNVEDL